MLWVRALSPEPDSLPFNVPEDARVTLRAGRHAVELAGSPLRAHPSRRGLEGPVPAPVPAGRCADMENTTDSGCER